MAPDFLDPTLDSLPGDAGDVAAGLADEVDALDAVGEVLSQTPMDVLHGYIAVFIVAFLVTLCATPIMRRVAVAMGVVDTPKEARKLHKTPVAYLGGVAVYLGILAGIVFSYLGFFGPVLPDTIFEIHSYDAAQHGMLAVPFSIVLGLTVIMVTGVIDDVVGLDPIYKISGQLLAAAALAMQQVGTKVAAGVMLPLADLVGLSTIESSPGVETVGFIIPIPGSGDGIPVDLIYWVGTAVIAVFVLGGCNASNLIDGLDGLLSGVTAMASVGLLVIALGLAVFDDGALDASRVVLVLCVLGACLGFLPHNFNPATIFLGDCGSLLLGFVTIVLILSLGDTGKTHLVVAGLIIYAIPIIDTALAIVRRKMAGRSMSEPDDQHLHHMLKRSLGTKGAVLTLYGIGALFAVLGVWLSFGRVRVVLTIALVVASFIGVIAVKIARRQAIEAQAVGAPDRTGPGKHGRRSAARYR